MQQGFEAVNNVTPEGMPAGGLVEGVGIKIWWQDGPLGRGADRIPPNGAFVEDVIAAAIQRIEHYQEVAGGRFACEENANALFHLRQAIIMLESRTANREKRGVEGTHQP